MLPSKSYSINQLRDYSSLFSRSEANRWMSGDFTSVNSKIARYDSINRLRSKTYLSYLRNVYKILKRDYPNEYVYKNEFISKWLIQEIGNEDSIVFNEFRLGKAVADLVMFNGNSKVFEIKTLLDKPSRLNNQLNQYQKLFNEVYILAPECKVDIYAMSDQLVGIICYSNSLGKFTLIRKATVNNVIDVDVLMQVLHTNEYISLVEMYYGFRPTITDFTKFEVCKNLMRSIPSEFMNDAFVKLMKERKIYNEFSKSNSHLNQLFLSLNFNLSQKMTLLSNLKAAIE